MTVTYPVPYPDLGGQHLAPGGGTVTSTKYLAAMSSTQALPWNTTVCWVPSKVSSEPPSCLARSTPAWYGVAGSFVVEITSVGGRPFTETSCGCVVGGTGHNAQVSFGAYPVNSP